MKKTLIIIAVSVLIAGGIYFVKHKNTFAPSSPKISETSGISVAPFVTEKSAGKYQSMDMSYPKSSATEYPEMYNFIQQSKADWLKDNGNISEVDAKEMGLGGERIYNYTMATRVATSSKTVTYILEIYEFTGGAHGNTSLTTFTYDKNKKIVTLADVFTKPYLEKISQLSRQHFYDTTEKEYINKDMIDSGTEPSADNFSVWYLSDSSVVFIFGQYQVGPYVIGMPEYAIPKSLLSDILSPMYK